MLTLLSAIHNQKEERTTMPKTKKTNSHIDFKKDKGESSQLLDLERIGTLVSNLQNKLLLLEAAQERVTDLQADITRLRTEEIPAVMDEFNLSEVKLKDGSKVHVRPLILANIPSEGAIMKCRDGQLAHAMRDRLNKCLSYLRKNGAAALIKTLLKANFGKDSEAEAKAAIAALKKLGVPAEVIKTVHPQSLNAWVRERIENGKPIDMELFKVFNGQMAEITTPNTERTL